MKSIPRRFSIPLALAIMLFAAAPLHAATLTVTNTNNSGAGSLRDTIVAAAPNDTILFAANLSGTIALTSGELLLNKNVSISYTGTGLIISGNSMSRVFFVAPGVTATLTNITIRNGNGFSTLAASGFGGGIFNLGTLSLRDCTIANNFASGGLGGGVFSDGSLILDRCTFSGNVSPGAAGGVGNLNVLRAQNCTFSGNIASADGGGILNGEGDSAQLVNCTLTANRADADGNGSGVGGALATTGSVTLNNTIVAGNFRGNGMTPNEISGMITSAGFNLVGDATTAGGIMHGANGNKVGNNGAGTLVTNTVLDPVLANNSGTTQTHALVNFSSALNAGSNALAVDSNNAPLATDQRGLARVVNSTVDIGAVESGAPLVSNLNDSGPGSLRAAVESGATYITFAPGLEGTIVLTRELEVRFGRDLTIETRGGRVAVSGNHIWKIFAVEQANLALIGLRIVDGGGSTAGLNYIQNPNGLGGALYSNLANVTLRNCSFSGNRADAGGAIYHDSGGQLNVFNSTISGNALYPNGSGGGIVSVGDMLIANSTIVGNILNGIEIFGSCTLRNSIVAGNLNGLGTGPSDISGTVNSATHNLIGNAATSGGIVHGVTGNIVGNNGTGTINLASVLNPVLADNGGARLSHALVPGSPALNAGLNSAAPDVTDQRGPGFVRIFNGTVDMGAIEARPGLPGRLAFGTQPSNGSANVPLVPTVTVQVLDDLAQLVTNSPLTIALSVNDPIATLTGASATTVNGVAEFPALTVTRARENLRLLASALSLGRAVSASFAISVSPVFNTNDDGPGSLREVIQDSPSGGVVTFANGVQGEIILSRSLIIFDKTLTIQGPGADRLSINGNFEERGFYLVGFSPAPAIHLSGLTIKNGVPATRDGRPDNLGGGIGAFGVDLTVTDCVVTNNTGTGIFSGRSGEWNTSKGSAKLVRCLLSGNSGEYGGGMHAEGPLQGIDCTFANNQAFAVGGGLYAVHPPSGFDAGHAATLTGCTFSGNQAVFRGAGIVASYPGNIPFTMTNCTVSQNFTTGTDSVGAGIYIDSNTPARITHCTIVGNRVGGDGVGGGILFNAFAGEILELRNSIVAGNFRGSSTSDDLWSRNPVTGSTHSLISDAATSGGIMHGVNGNIVGNNGTGTLPLVSVLNPTLANNGGRTATHALVASSLAINAGEDSLAPVLDQRSYVRNGVSDMGAFEFNGTPAPPLSLVKVVSRKLHGGTAYDLDLLLAGPAPSESRTGGANGEHTLLFTFVDDLASVGGAEITGGTGSIRNIQFTSDPREVIVNLTGVANAQRLTVSLTNLVGILGNQRSAVRVTMGLLAGDTNGNGTVNASDVGQTKAFSGRAVDRTNFRNDVTVDNALNASDIGLVKSRSGNQIPGSRIMEGRPSEER